MKIVKGVLDSRFTQVHGASNRRITKFAVSCNARGEAVVGFYQRNSSGGGDAYGAVMYGP